MTLWINHLRQKLARGEVATSMIVRMSRGPEVGAIAQAAGFDSLYIDLEHSPLGLETVSVLCHSAQAARVTPLARVPAVDGGLITRLLDGGAMGIVAPHVTSAADAARLVSCCRYPPSGSRSTSSTLPQLGYGKRSGEFATQAEAHAAVDREMLVVAMIESVAGLDNVQDIAGVDGIDILLVGAGDLSADLGCSGRLDDPALSDAFDRVIDACKRAGKHAGIGGMAGRPDLLEQLVAQGARYLSLGTDTAFMVAGGAAAVRRIRALK
jgi:2-keto-3-deoxy-L-rhamnonate aldolase RhmA